jgi:hypothetical protein
MGAIPTNKYGNVVWIGWQPTFNIFLMKYNEMSLKRGDNL